MTPPLGARGPAYGGEYYTPTLRLALWHVFLQHTRAQTVSGPPQSPTRSLEGLGSQTDPPTPWYNGRAGIIHFRYSPGLLGGKGTSHVGPAMSGGKKIRESNPFRPICPPRRNACGASAPSPLGVKTLFSEQGPGWSSWCRVPREREREVYQ